MKEPKDMSFTELQELDTVLAERDVKLTEQIKALEVTPSSNIPSPQDTAQVHTPEHAGEHTAVTEEKKVVPDGKGGDVSEMKEEELAKMIELKLTEAFTKLLNEEASPFKKLGAEWDAFKAKHEKDYANLEELKGKMETFTKVHEAETASAKATEKKLTEMEVKLKEALATANAHGVVATAEQTAAGVAGKTGGAGNPPTDAPIERPKTFAGRMNAAARERPRTR